MGCTNLPVLINARVGGVRTAAGRAVGVDCVGTDGAIDLTADRIVLCAGAIGSAHLLMLSGVGPQGVLQTVGVPVVAYLPIGMACVGHPEFVFSVDWSTSHLLPPLEALLITDIGLVITPST